MAIFIGCVIVRKDGQWAFQVILSGWTLLCLSASLCSLQDLALCRIAGVTKEGFIQAVSRVAPQLHRLALNLLPFEQLDEVEHSPSEHFHDFPWTLQNGQRFPLHSLLGSSNELLPLCKRLKTLYLRDPMAVPGVVSRLHQLTTLHLCHTPVGPSIVDVDKIILRWELPFLQELYTYREDCSWDDRRVLGGPTYGSRLPLLFRNEFKGAIKSIAPPYSVNAALESAEVSAQIWL